MGVFIIIICIFAQVLFGSRVKKETIVNIVPNSINYVKEEEILGLAKFKEMVEDVLYKDYMKSDPYLIRFLRARKFDLKAAEKMLRRALSWRKDNGIDGILSETIHEQKYIPVYLDGSDYDGSLVVQFMIARWDTRKFVLSGKRDVQVRWWLQYLEQMELDVMRRCGIIGNGNSSRSFGKSPDKVTMIIDADGFNTKQHGCSDCVGVYLELFTVFEEYYPGYAKHMIAVNVPKVFGTLFELVKPILSEETKAGLKIYWPNQKGWREALGRILSFEQLRPPLGTKTEVFNQSLSSLSNTTIPPTKPIPIEPI